jgi:Fanconi anemia group M protein
LEGVRIIVDNRERNIELLECLSRSGVELSFAQLPVGDYVLSDRICVERKTVRDFEGSVMNARLFDQMDRLSSGFRKPMLILEGDEAEFLLQPNVVLGTIVSIYSDYNVQVIRSSCVSETSLILAKLAEREQKKGKREPRIVGSKRAFSDSQWQELILGSMPGVGPKLARSLLSRFRTIVNVAAASEKELMEVDKVGKKKAKRIRSILNDEFDEKQ